MKIVSVKAKNFLSYKDLDFSFEKGLTLISGWNNDQNSSNGSGKSGIIDCVSYALFGKTARDIKIDELIRHGQSQMFVSILLENNGDRVEIQRLRNPNKLQLTINDKVVDFQDLNDGQEKINKHLGIDYKLFLNSIYFAQAKSGQFLQANDEDKKNILLDILNLDEFENAYKKAHEDLKAHTDKLLKTKDLIESKKTRNLESIARLEKYITLSRGFDDNKAKDLKNIESEYGQMSADLDELEKELTGYNYDSAGYDTRHARYMKALEISDKVKIASKDQSRMHSQVEVLKEKIIASKETLKQLHTNICPTCSQNLPPDNGLVEKETSYVKGYAVEYQVKKDQLVKLEQFIALNSHGSDQEMLDSKMDLEKYAGAKDRIESIKNKKNSIFNRLKQLDDHKEEIKGRANDYDILINQERLTVEESKKNIIDLTQDESKIERDICYTEALKSIFGPQGVRAIVLDNSINQLNQLANEYLRELFDSPIIINFAIEKSETKSAVKQKVATNITFAGREVSLDSLSGGEKRRLKISVDLAIGYLVKLRSGKSLSVTLLDEVTDGLDASGREKLFSLLKKLSLDVDIYIVDHACEFKGLFDNVVEIQKSNGVSEVQ